MMGDAPDSYEHELRPTSSGDDILSESGRASFNKDA